VVNEIIEISIHIISIILIQLFEMPVNALANSRNANDDVNLNNLTNTDYFWDERFAKYQNLIF
jgi:hypothetical protein